MNRQLRIARSAYLLTWKRASFDLIQQGAGVEEKQQEKAIHLDDAVKELNLKADTDKATVHRRVVT
jgi:hypothetical protein